MFYREVIFIFFPGIKNFIGATNDTVGLDFGGFESFAYSFVKSPNASSVIRGRGVIDGRSSISEDRTFTLSFTCSEDHFYDLIFFYHLSGIFGLIPMKNSEIFDKVFTPYGEYLKTDIHSNVFDSSDPEFFAVGKSVSDSINRALKSSDNNFFVFLKRMSIKTIPGTTLTFVVELELIPYFNSLNLVLRQNSFFANYKTAFAKKSPAIQSLYNFVKSKPVKAESSLSLVPVLKSHMSSGVTNSQKLAAAVLPSISIDSKFITNLEVVLYNNIVSLPLQSYSPSFQHLGKGEVGVTIGLDFARDFGNNSDSFSTISKQFNLVSRMNHKTHYLSVNHWLFDCFDLTNFYMQGCTILDKESDTSQQSAISAFFLANSYTQDELLFNAYKARASDYTVESQIKDAVNTFRFFLKEYRNSSDKKNFFGPDLLDAFSYKSIHALFPDSESVYKLIIGESKNIPTYTSTGLILCMLANSDAGRGKILSAITMAEKNSKSVYNLIGSYFFAEIFFFPSSGIVFSDTRDIEFRKFCIYFLYQNFFGLFFKEAILGNIIFSNAFSSCHTAVKASLVSQLETAFTDKKELFNLTSVSLAEYVSAAEVIITTELNRLQTSVKDSFLSIVNLDIKGLLVDDSQMPKNFMFYFCTEFFAGALSPYGESITGFESPIMAVSGEFFSLASHFLSNPTVYQDMLKRDSSKLLPSQDSFGRNLTGSSDYNIPNFDYDVYFDGKSFWAADGHPSDLIKSSLGEVGLKSISDDIYKIFNDATIPSGSLKGVISKYTDEQQSKLSMADKIFYDIGTLSKTSAEQIKTRLNKCSALFSSQLYDFMPVMYLEFCNRTTATNSQSMDQYHTLNTYGYANKIVDTAVTTDPNTRIKTCKITLLDVEFIKKTVINNKTYVLNEGSALDTRFEYSPQNFPIGIGSRICLSIGNSKKELNTIFTGTVESVSVDTEKNYLILDCASFAKTVYSGDYNVSLGPGGRGIVENVFSFDNLANTFEHLKNQFKYNDTYYKNLHKLHTHAATLRGNLNKDSIPISEYPLDYFMSTDFQITSYYILASHLSQAARTYLQSLNEISNTGSLSFINNSTKLSYGGFAYTKKNIDKGGILKNINNVDFDFSFYGVRKRVSATDKKLYYNTSPYCDILFPVSGDKPSKKDAAISVLATSAFEVKSLSSVSLKINSSDEVIESTNVLGPKVYYKDESGKDGVSQTYRKKSATIADLLNDMENRYSGALWDVIEDGRGATLFFGRSNYFINRVKSPYSFGLEKLDAIQNTKITINDDMSVSQVIKTVSSVQSESKKKLDVTEPYRNQFVAISGVNLISCHIESNMNIANTAVVNYDYSWASQFLVNFDNLLKKLFTSEELGKVTVPSLSNIPEELQIPIQNTKESEENINSESQAYEYGLSMLEKEYAKFYSGKIVLTYSPEVRVGTELFISDAYNKIFGSVICSNVSHYCNAEEGFITVVTPAMKVDNNSPNESLTLNLKGIAVSEKLNGKGAKFPDYQKISACVVANNFPITTSPGVISYEVTQKDSNYQFNNSLKYPSDQGLALGCTFYPIQHNAKIMSPYSEELKVYSIGAAHSATVLYNSGTSLDKKAYFYERWYTGIKNWFGEVSSSFTNLFWEKSPGFSLLDLMKVEDTPTYDSPVIINSPQRTTFFVAISKNFIFDVFKNKTTIDFLVKILKDDKLTYKESRYPGFYLLDPKSKDFSAYRGILSTIMEGNSKVKTSYGLSGFSEILKNTLVPDKSYDFLFKKDEKKLMIKVYEACLSKGVVFEYFLNYFAAYNFARFIDKQGFHNALLINLGVDASIKSSLFKGESYTDDTFRSELFTLFNNSLLTAQKAGLSYTNAVFLNFSHNFQDPYLANYFGGANNDTKELYLKGDSKIFKESGNFFIPDSADKRYDLLRPVLEKTSKVLGGNAIYNYDSDVQLFQKVVQDTGLQNIVVFKGPNPIKGLLKFNTNDFYAYDMKNKFFNNIVNVSIPDSIGKRVLTDSTPSDIRKALGIHKMTLDGKVVYPTYFLPDATNTVVAQTLICLTLSILSESKTFMSVIKDLADSSKLYKFLSNENNKKTKNLFSKFISSTDDLDDSVYQSFKNYSVNLANSINDIIPLFVAYMPNFSKDNFRYFDAGYWNNENCDFPYKDFYDSKGNKLPVTSDGKEFFTFIFKIFGIAQASYFSKITVHNEVYFVYHPSFAPAKNYNFNKLNNTFEKFVSELVYVHLRVLKNYYTGSSSGISEKQILLKEVRSFSYGDTSKKEFALIVSNNEKISDITFTYKGSFEELHATKVKQTTLFNVLKVAIPAFGDSKKASDLFFVHMPETIYEGDISKSEENNKKKSEALFKLIESNKSKNSSQSFLLGDTNFNSPADSKLSTAVYNKPFKKIKNFTPTSLGEAELDQIYYDSSGSFYCSYTNYAIHVDNRVTKKGKMYSNHPIIFVKSTSDNITDDKSKLLLGSYIEKGVSSQKVLFYKK